ncbi:MAG: pentapeptide repeat-containing protein [Nitrospira sp.]|nr:pentapeptide repeat-containing protein [Nitrospira sp.]
MANAKHLGYLKRRVSEWNRWIKNNFHIQPDLSGADLAEADLTGANLREADLRGAHLIGANLREANLRQANLRGANLREVNLRQANLRGAHLVGANLVGANLAGANLREADLSGAHLRGAHLDGADLSVAHLDMADLSVANLDRANLREANLDRANLREANLDKANLREADLRGAHLIGANLREANLAGANLSKADLANANLEQATLVKMTCNKTIFTGCRIYGISAWDLRLEEAEQTNLVITPLGEPDITVDKLEVAQFIYLLLNNRSIREVIDTITSKVVLILGRFTPERKVVLDALRNELRRHNFTPVLFDFAIPADRDITETVTLLARMARFIVADLTDPASIPMELQAIAPDLAVPIRSLVHKNQEPFSMFGTLKKYHWVLPPYRYSNTDELLANLRGEVIAPAELKFSELKKSR